jgi:hypothetical protein
MKTLLGFALGVAVGGAVAIALLPEPRQRFRELGARLAEIDGIGRLAQDASRLGQQALAAAQERYRLALAEAQQAREEAKRDLWSQFEAAKRHGQLPPPALPPPA